MNRILIGLLALVGMCGAALAQSSPGLVFGQVPTAGQWNSYFAAKQDTLGYTPVNKSGDVMQGPLITAASTISLSGFNIPPGVAPTVPQNGDIWETTAGIFARVNGVTSQVLISGGSGGTFITPVTINLTGGSLPAADTGTLLAGANASAVASRIELTAFGATAIYTGRASNGTFASPTVLTSGTLITQLNAHGFDGAWTTTASGAFRLYAEGTWSGTSHPTEGCISTTPSASTVIADIFCVHATGSAFLAGPQLLIGAPTTNLTSTLVAHAATNENFSISSNVVLASGVTFGSVNDANTTLQPLEMRSSQTNFTTGGVVISTAIAQTPPNATSLTISANAAIPATSPVAGTALWLVGSNGTGTNNILTMDQYGGAATAANSMSMRQGNGTAASPTATTSGNILGSFSWLGYTGSVFYGSAFIQVTANETFSGTAGGADMQFFTTPNTTHILAQTMTLRAGGGLIMGIPGTLDPGFGGIATSPNTVGGIGTCNATTKTSRRFVTDATLNTFHSTAVGGGANNVAVVCDGTNWYID